MLERGLVHPKGLQERFEAIAPSFHRYPAIDPAAFRRALERVIQ